MIQRRIIFYKRIAPYLKVKLYLLKEEIFVIKNFFWFFKIDFAFFIFYLFLNPYRVARKKNNVYGETPISSLYKICTECKIGKEDLFLELGSGRGKGCFWVAKFTGCQVIGIEWISSFVKIASILKKLFRVSNLTFIEEDFFNINVIKASVIYLYGTTLSDSEIEKLVQKKFAPNTKIISISYSLEEYSSHFKTVKSFSVSFPWGTTTCYLTRISD